MRIVVLRECGLASVYEQDENTFELIRRGFYNWEYEAGEELEKFRSKLPKLDLFPKSLEKFYQYGY